MINSFLVFKDLSEINILLDPTHRAAAEALIGWTPDQSELCCVDLCVQEVFTAQVILRIKHFYVKDRCFSDAVWWTPELLLTFSQLVSLVTSDPDSR